jgi:anti-anti-sigma regulatory factor
MNDPFVLPPELTIYSAVETRDALLTWVTEQGAKASGQLSISARDVGVVDGAGLQLLAALSNMDLHWQLIESSAAFTEACQTIGLAAWLDGTLDKDAGAAP